MIKQINFSSLNGEYISESGENVSVFLIVYQDSIHWNDEKKESGYFFINVKGKECSLKSFHLKYQAELKFKNLIKDENAVVTTSICPFDENMVFITISLGVFKTKNFSTDHEFTLFEVKTNSMGVELTFVTTKEKLKV